MTKSLFRSAWQGPRWAFLKNLRRCTRCLRTVIRHMRPLSRHRRRALPPTHDSSHARGDPSTRIAIRAAVALERISKQSLLCRQLLPQRLDSALLSTVNSAGGERFDSYANVREAFVQLHRHTDHGGELRKRGQVTAPAPSSTAAVCPATTRPPRLTTCAHTAGT
jgi:hypothetical protein